MNFYLQTELNIIYFFANILTRYDQGIVILTVLNLIEIKNNINIPRGCCFILKPEEQGPTPRIKGFYERMKITL